MEIVTLILEYYNSGKYGIDCKNVRGRTQLLRAFWNDALELAKFLIKNGANVDTKDYDGDAPLEDACRRDSVEPVQLLIENGACVSTEAVHAACFSIVRWRFSNSCLTTVEMSMLEMAMMLHRCM